MDFKKTLDEAAETVLKHRAGEYGTDSFEPMWIRVAEVWSGILGHTITPTEASLMMVGMKLVRCQFAPQKLDSYVDAIGYAGIASSISEAGCLDAPAPMSEFNAHRADEEAKAIVRLRAVLAAEEQEPIVTDSFDDFDDSPSGAEHVHKWRPNGTCSVRVASYGPDGRKWWEDCPAVKPTEDE